MRENAGKMRTRVTPNTGTFYAVTLLNAQCNKRWSIYFCLQVSIKFMFNANQRKHLRRILGNKGNYNRNNGFYEIFYSPTQNVFTSQLPYSVTQTFSASEILIDPFVHFFLYPLKTWKNLAVLWCFRGYRKDALVTNGLITFQGDKKQLKLITVPGGVAQINCFKKFGQFQWIIGETICRVFLQ